MTMPTSCKVITKYTFFAATYILMFVLHPADMFAMKVKVAALVISGTVHLTRAGPDLRGV